MRWESTFNIPGRTVAAPPSHTAMHIGSFYIDKYPVTNAEFKRFLDATHYHPADDHNFLKDWKNGTYPAGLGEQAGDLGFAGRRARLCEVGGQALAARMGMAVCRARHRRRACIPGAMIGIAAAVPQPDKGRDMRAPAKRCRRAPEGRQSVWGDGPGRQRMAMDRRVRRRTHSRRDPARRQLLPAAGLTLVLPQAYRLIEHGKYLLMAPSLDRSGAIGFRCVVDSEPAEH